MELRKNLHGLQLLRGFRPVLTFPPFSIITSAMGHPKILIGAFGHLGLYFPDASAPRTMICIVMAFPDWNNKYF
jgi:hypothetical protein